MAAMPRWNQAILYNFALFCEKTGVSDNAMTCFSVSMGDE